eukprot:GHVU01161323.1.p1 GENE.GHVU01161323.1~~GHVU01161323.1.p1  ORF type:complete len:427 (-),score=21.48 GHVU01161323.1:63-1343(-)
MTLENDYFYVELLRQNTMLLRFLTIDEDDCLLDTAAKHAVVASIVHELSDAAGSYRQRLSWEQHVAQLHQESAGAFARMYRMPEEAFVRLCTLLAPYVVKQPQKALIKEHESLIDVRLIMHCMLRWLAGGSYLDIRVVAGICCASFYRAVHDGMDAVCRCEELAYHFPQTLEEINAAADAFKACSSDEVITGCVGAVDGLHVSIKTPSTKETGNVKAYFSGHKQNNGVNVQAVCDHLCRFLEVCVAKPGGTNDVVAFAASAMQHMIECLPRGRYVVGDNAYVPTEHLMTPFAGSQRAFPGHDSFNFHLSQLRIRIEQAFGLMVGRWRILKGPLQVKLRHVGKVVMCISRLHNYCINERLRLNNPLDDVEIEPVFTVDGRQLGYVPSDISVVSVPGNCVIREYIVSDITGTGIGRPTTNIVRNRDSH